MFFYRSVVLLIVFILSLTISPCLAEVNFSLGGGYLSGDTQYQIGGHVDYDYLADEEIHFPLSELKFPLDAYMVKGQVDGNIGSRWNFTVSAATNLTEDTGKMEDSDWGVYAPVDPDRLDVYSESDTEMTALVFEGKVSYNFYEGYYGQGAANAQIADAATRFIYSVGLGYKYQDFDFAVYDLDQWYPSAPATPHDRVSGLVLKYEAQYQIPYLELAMKMNAHEKFILDLSVGYAPFVNFSDKDQHLLRGKVNKADHDWNGFALMANLSARYKLTPHWSIGGELAFMKIESEGESRATFTGADSIYNHTIDHEIESQQFSTYLTVGYTF